VTVPSDPEPSRHGRLRAAQGTTALVFCAMAANFTPTPLYPRYQAVWSLSASQVSLVFSAYAVGVLAVLVTLGGLSDRIGRLPTLRGAAGLVLLSLVVLAAAPTYEVLLAGRLIQGLGTGVVASAGAAAMLDFHPKGVRAGSFQFTLVISSGIALGPALAGLVASELPNPLVTPYVVVGLLTFGAAALLLTASIPEARSAGERLLQPIRVPRRLWTAFAGASIAIVSTNIAFGAMGTFGPEVAQGVGWQSSAAAGALVSAMLVAVAGMQVLGRGVPITIGLVAGCATGALGWAMLLLALRSDAAWAAVSGTLILGAGAGLALLSSAALVGAIAPVERRAEIQAAYFVAAFLAVATASLTLGPVVHRASLDTAMIVAATADLVLTAAVAVLLIRRPVTLAGTEAPPAP
jgi:predicted MFS family arabinose efflux permease